MGQGGAITPVILCGGSGTRLWPASRESLPKQLIPLLGPHSTFQEAALRVSRHPLFATPIVIAAHEVRFIVAEQLAAVGARAEILLEPTRRDSAAAVAAATCFAARRSPDGVVLTLAADHVIDDEAGFVAACGLAAAAAQAGSIMTLGVVPRGPSTAFGYIRPGTAIAGTAAFQVAAFVEKPDRATAEGYIAQGYLWNSGNFLFRADVMQRELGLHAPDILRAAREAVERAATDLDFTRLDATAFAAAPKTSIDYAVMERTRQAGVLPVSFGWSDIGSWGALWEASPHDPQGNVVRGQAELLDARDSLVVSDSILTTVVGLDDIVVIATPDAVLVTSREGSERVKDLVGVLRQRGRPEADAHLKMYRPWGWYQRIDIGPRFQVKRIMVKPGGRLSLQKHFHRAEHWVVVRGTAEVTVDERVALVQENESIYVPLGAVHSLANPGRIDLELIEVQVGSYTGEDDIVRVKDVYGR